MRNIITIDVDTERENPIKINKPEEFHPTQETYDDMIIQDVEVLVSTSLYLLSMLDEEVEKKGLFTIMETIKNRIDEL